MIFLFLAVLLLFSSHTMAFKPERPVILVHGIGFNGTLAWQSPPVLRYFELINKGLAEFLVESSGYTRGKDLFIYEYDTMATIEHIANEFNLALTKYLRQSGATKVDLICFSMGGLVARTLLNGATDPPVENLITIATPHKGSYWVSVAESVKPQADDFLFKILGELRDNLADDVSLKTYRFLDSVYRFGEYPSIGQMQPEGEFMEKLASFSFSPHIKVTCIAGYVLPSFDSAFVPETFVRLLSERFGPGDLVVPLESALWERADQIFIVKGRPETTWHSVLPFHPEVQALVKYVLSESYMQKQLGRLE